MLADIRRQPEVLSALLARHMELSAFVEEHLQPVTDGRLHLFGSGDGWFAARLACGRDPAARCLAWSGLEFVLNRAPRLTPHDHALAISMSGNVDRTIEGAIAARARARALAIVTNTGGRLASLGAPAFRLEIPEIAPFLCGTSTYAATLIALQLITAMVEGGEVAAYRATLADAVDRLPALIEAADALAQSVAKALGRGLAGIRFLAAGGNSGTADYGAAKMVELSQVPAWSDDLEEFGHRQFWTVGRRELVVLLPATSAAAGYANAAAQALAELPLATLALEPAAASIGAAQYRLAVGGAGPATALTQAVALQLLCYRLAEATGGDPDRRLHLKADRARFRVSRLLTRRDLVGTGA
jgi:fructoselysine-6-P-deglycase FrlB-like protein